MAGIFSIIPWVADLFTASGKQVPELEARARALLAQYPDVKEAGEIFLKETVPIIEASIGDRASTMALMTKVWNDFTGENPGFDENAIFGA